MIRLSGLYLLLMPLVVNAESALIAVSANFAPAAAELAELFEAETGHELELAAGSTGKLYAQIRNGAPYDVFLAADQLRPERLEDDGHAVAGSRFTYAVGRLALWIPAADTELPPESAIRLVADARRLAIANPDLAPYGMAAREVLDRFALNIEETRVVRGENVAQAYAMVASGAADAGLVALSLLLTRSHRSWWPLPAHWHRPVRQDAVLLHHGAANRAAQDFLEFMRSEAVHQRLLALGYAGSADA